MTPHPRGEALRTQRALMPVKRLVYLSPLRWGDFAQRPHHFVHWHHASHGGEVLWVQPYPSRLPRWDDLQRLGASRRRPGGAVPPWLSLCDVPALPLEPLDAAAPLNGLLWQGVLKRVRAFAAQGPCELVIGKPSRLALQVLDAGCFVRTVLDAMDDFPVFHDGLARRTLEAAERRLAARVDAVLASSTRLVAKFAAQGVRARLARNACEPDALPGSGEVQGLREPGRVGYVGTMAGWFDWALIAGLAHAHPALRFELLGPLHGPLPRALPPNVRLHPPRPHGEAMREMARCAVGLIPFRRSALTEAVDPVKYYEYRALGIPVLATAFGEMPFHARGDPGLFLAHAAGACAQEALAAALAFGSDDAQRMRAFRTRHAWRCRFDQAMGGSADELLAEDAVQLG